MALRQSGVIIAEHLEPGNQIDADERSRDCSPYNLAAAMDGLESGHGLRVVK
jgi:hypothetical protein